MRPHLPFVPPSPLPSSLDPGVVATRWYPVPGGVAVHDELHAMWRPGEPPEVCVAGRWHRAARAARSIAAATALAIGLLFQLDRDEDRRRELRARELADEHRRRYGDRPQLAPAERFRLWLEKADHAACGACGKGAACSSLNRRVFSVCVAACRGFDLEPADALPLVAAWNEGNAPPLPRKALERKLRDARERGRMPRGHLLERRAAA